MTFREWLAALFGHTPPTPDPVRQKLDSQQRNIADRLGRMKGVTRDDVLSEAYRRARTLEEERSYRQGRS